jgi:hypothetical protein
LSGYPIEIYGYLEINDRPPLSGYPIEIYGYLEERARHLNPNLRTQNLGVNPGLNQGFGVLRCGTSDYLSNDVSALQRQPSGLYCIMCPDWVQKVFFSSLLGVKGTLLEKLVFCLFAKNG